jgi:hypothetical protein
MKQLCLSAWAVALLWLLWPGPLSSHEGVKTSVTFDREISRILTARCINCHSENTLSFPLTTYEETRPWAQAIAEEVLSREMPPWRAVPGYGKFANDGGLTTRELQTIVAWVQGAGPKTPEQRLILTIDQGRTSEDLRLRPDFDRWQLGQPDLVRPVTFGAGASQSTVVRTLVAAETSDRRLRGLEFRPRDRRALRAAFFWIEGTGQWLGSWTPWHAGNTLPDGAAYLLPAGSRIVAELTYQGTPEPAADAGQLGLYYAAGSPASCPTDLVMRTSESVPARATDHKMQAVTTLAGDTTVLALVPRFQKGTSRFELRARKPDGGVDVLLLVRNVLQEWPTPYILESPVRLPKGSQLAATAYYQNSADEARSGGIDLRVSGYAGSGCSIAAARSN